MTLKATVSKITVELRGRRAVISVGGNSCILTREEFKELLGIITEAVESTYYTDRWSDDAG